MVSNFSLSHRTEPRRISKRFRWSSEGRSLTMTGTVRCSSPTSRMAEPRKSEDESVRTRARTKRNMICPRREPLARHSRQFPDREESEHVPQRQDDAPVPAVGAPLVQETGRVDAALRNAEVSRVGGVVELGPELQSLRFTEPGVLEQPEVQVADAV